MGPFASLIAQRNADFMLNKYKEVRLLNRINFRKLWQHASEETQNSLWNHVNTLWTMSLTIQTFSSDQIRVVEGVASQMKNMFLKNDESRNLLKSLGGAFGIQVRDEHLDEIGSQDFGSLLKESVKSIRETTTVRTEEKTEGETSASSSVPKSESVGAHDATPDEPAEDGARATGSD